MRAGFHALRKACAGQCSPCTCGLTAHASTSNHAGQSACVHAALCVPCTEHGPCALWVGCRYHYLATPMSFRHAALPDCHLEVIPVQGVSTLTRMRCEGCCSVRGASFWGWYVVYHDDSDGWTGFDWFYKALSMCNAVRVPMLPPYTSSDAVHVLIC